jgi:hypothetical protein
MKTMKRTLKASCILAAAAICLSGLASPASAQVMDQIPSDALVVIKINHLQETDTKVANLLQTLGVTDLVPTMKDPLATLETQLGIGPGIDTKKDAAAAILNGDMEKPQPPFVLLLPVSDYKAFLGSVTTVRTEGDVSIVHFKDNEDDAFVENWGDYAAISDKKENVLVKHEGLKPTGLSKKQLDDQDLCVYVNMPALKTVLLPKLGEGSKSASEEIAKQITDPAKLKIAQVALQEGVTFATEFLNDTQGITMGLSIGNDGISGNTVVDFMPDTYLGKLATQVKVTDQSLLTGLPKENYIFFGGSIQNPAVTAQVIEDAVAPISKELPGLGDDGKKLVELIDLYKQLFTATDSATYGVVAPTAALGQGSLFRLIAIYKGDAEKIKTAQFKAADLQNDVMKAFGVGQAADLMKTTVTPNFKTVNGVKFDQLKTEVNPDNTSQQAMQMSEMLSMMYGPDGASALNGVLDPKTLIMTLGVDDDLIGQVIDAAKANTDVLTDEVKTVDSNLPKMRAGVAYLSLGQLVTTGLNYAKASGMNVGIQLPNNLPPIAFSVGTEGTAMRGDMFVPTKLLQSMVQAGATIFQQFSGHGGGGGGL